MRLKEIKPNTAIHCTSKEQIQCLIDVGIVSENYAEFDVPIWICFYGDGIFSWMPEVDSKGIKGKNYYEEKGIRVVELSDLIISELTAEEALLAYDQMCKENYCCNDCPIYGILGHECAKRMDGHITEIVDAIKKWKADHDKKEPKIETVDICRIIEVLSDGRKRCVHEEDIDIDRDLPFEDENAEIRRILKAYCADHDGEFIAVHEVVSRVKAVE